MAAMELWTAAHGVASLLISRPYPPFGDVEQFVDRVPRSACCGYIVTAMVGTDVPPQEAVNRIRGIAND